MVTNKQLPRTLHVLMNGINVGQLKKTADNQLNFKYTKNWLATPAARPISLSMPLLNQTYKGEAVFHYFDNLLPQSPKTRARIQAQFKTKSNHPFDLLQAVGKDCIGALQFVSGRVPVFGKKIRFETLGETGVAKRLSNPEKHPLGMSPGLDTFCLSLPGSSDKTAFLYHNNTWVRPRDKTPTTHIIKLAPLDAPHTAKAAWLCTQIAKSFGLPAANAHLMHFEEIETLVIERFDRRYASDGSWIVRLPQETIAQAKGLSANIRHCLSEPKQFKNTMQFLLGSSNPIYDRDLLFCTHVLHTLLQTKNNHLSDLSVFILPEGKYRLTPLYDLDSAHLDASHQIPAISKQSLLKTAKLSNYSVERAQMILQDMLARLDSVIEEVTATLPNAFPTCVSIGIFKGMQTIRNQLTQKAATLPSKDAAHA